MRPVFSYARREAPATQPARNAFETKGRVAELLANDRFRSFPTSSLDVRHTPGMSKLVTDAVHIARNNVGIGRVERLKRFITSTSACIVLCLVCSSALASGTSRWHTGGPDGAYIAALAVDPRNEGTLYIGTTGGHVFKSRDGGGHWTDVGLRIKARAYILSLAIDPHDPRTIYAGTHGSGTYRSTNGGAHWEQIGLQAYDVEEITFDPRSPSNIFAATRFDVSTSTTRGKYWRAFSKGLEEEIRAIAFDPDGGGTLYVGGEAGVLFVSRNRGRTWTAAHKFGAEIIRDIAVRTADPATIYVATSAGVYRRQRNEDWTKLATSAEGSDDRAIVIDPQASSVLYVATAEQGVLKSEDDGTSWKVVNSGISPLAVTGLAIDPRHPSVLYAASGPALFRSTDAAATWSSLTPGLRDLDMMAVANHPTDVDTLYAATCNDVFKTSDQGKTWRAIFHIEPCVRVLVVSPREPDLILAGTDNGIFKSADAGDHWQRVESSARRQGVLAVGIDPLDPHRFYAGFDGDGGMLRTSDAGQSWTKVLSGTVFRIAVAPHTPQTIYAAVHVYAAVPAESDSEILRSDDAGVSWTGTGMTGALLRRVHEQVSVWAIAVDPSDSNVVYAAGRDPGGEYGGVFKSSDGGHTWKVMATGLTSPASYALAINPRNPKELYVGTESGTFKTTDGGEHWTEFSNGLPHLPIRALTVDGAGALLSAATERGVFHVDLDVQR